VKIAFEPEHSHVLLLCSQQDGEKLAEDEKKSIINVFNDWLSKWIIAD